MFCPAELFTIGVSNSEEQETKSPTTDTMQICIQIITCFIRVKNVCKFVIKQGTCSVVNSVAKVLQILRPGKRTPYANAIFIALIISVLQNTPYANLLTMGN